LIRLEGSRPDLMKDKP